MYWIYTCIFAFGIFVSGMILYSIMLNMNNPLSYIPLLIGAGISVMIIVINTDWQNKELSQSSESGVMK